MSTLIRSRSRRIAPFAKLETISAGTRQTYITDHFFRHETIVERVDFVFANNTQWKLENGVWATRSRGNHLTESYRLLDDQMPTGRNLLAEFGGQAHVTGDDELIPIELMSELVPGDYLALTANNTDGSDVKTLNGRAHLSELVNETPGFGSRLGVV